MVKKSLGALLVLLFVFFISSIVTMVSRPSRQLGVKAISEIAVDSDRAIANFSDSLKFQTISYQDPSQIDYQPFLDFHKFLEERYPLIHSVLKKETINQYSLLYTWEGTNQDLSPIILIAHIDVVPAKEEKNSKWTYAPFSGAIAGGYIWGRGAIDIKINVMSAMEAVENLLEKKFIPQRTIYLAFGHDEELGGFQGHQKIAEIVKSRSGKLEFLLDEGGAVTSDIISGVDSPVALVGIAEKGYLTLELSVKAEGGHSSMPPAETSVGILCNAVTRLHENPFPLKFTAAPEAMLEYLAPNMPAINRFLVSNLWWSGGLIKSQLSKSPAMAAALHTTIAPTMLVGSDKENTLPVVAKATINLRLIQGDTYESVINYIKKTIDDDRVSISRVGFAHEPSPVSDIDSASFRLIQKSIGEVFPGSIVSPYLLAGGTDSRFYADFAKAIYRFSPVALTAEDLKRIHGIDERVPIQNYIQSVRYFIRLLQNSNQEI